VLSIWPWLWFAAYLVVHLAAWWLAVSVDWACVNRWYRRSVKRSVMRFCRQVRFVTLVVVSKRLPGQRVFVRQGVSNIRFGVLVVWGLVRLGYCVFWLCFIALVAMSRALLAVAVAMGDLIQGY